MNITQTYLCFQIHCSSGGMEMPILSIQVSKTLGIIISKRIISKLIFQLALAPLICIFGKALKSLELSPPVFPAGSVL